MIIASLILISVCIFGGVVIVWKRKNNNRNSMLHQELETRVHPEIQQESEYVPAPSKITNSTNGKISKSVRTNFMKQRKNKNKTILN